MIERLADGQTWEVDTQGRSPSFTPDSPHVIWAVYDEDAPSDNREETLWQANVDGSNPKILLKERRIGLAAWLADNKLLLSQRIPGGSDVQLPLESSMIIIGLIDSLVTGLIVDSISDIARGAKDFTLSPGGRGLPSDHLVEAEVDSDGAHVLILNADALLTPEEKSALAGPLKQGGEGFTGDEMGLKKPGVI